MGFKTSKITIKITVKHTCCLLDDREKKHKTCRLHLACVSCVLSQQPLLVEPHRRLRRSWDDASWLLVTMTADRWNSLNHRNQPPYPLDLGSHFHWGNPGKTWGIWGIEIGWRWNMAKHRALTMQNMDLTCWNGADRGKGDRIRGKWW